MTLNYIQDSLLPNFLDIFLSLLRKERRPFQLTAACCVILGTVLSPGTRVSRLKFVRDNSHETKNAEELGKFRCISFLYYYCEYPSNSVVIVTIVDCGCGAFSTTSMPSCKLQYFENFIPGLRLILLLVRVL